MVSELKVTTRTGLVLIGRLFHSPAAKTVLILVTGVEGNIYNNPFYSVIGHQLQQQKVDLVVAHTRDAFNVTNAVNQINGRQETYGAFDEYFQDGDDDVAAYVNFAMQHRYAHLILGGQSLGANKVIHYLANHPEAPIEHFIFMSPVNLAVLRKKIGRGQRSVIQEMVNAGRNEERLPFRLFRWLTSTAGNANRWLTDNTLDNVHFDHRGNFSQLKAITKSGAFLIGENDHFTGGDPATYLRTLNRQMATAQQNQLILIRKASHIYRNHEQEVSADISNLLKNWHVLG
ncbi:hypothetical protein HMPREF0501_01227 [Limosilactobacillus coleohominis 101-4-CHN]|uniref:Serine aminopeptidase S33 domain-containing protein n=1 Tax=Limosilactobacillus coleohominis 101-4-CHN TaxID=575594 RepID=C7XWG2_9LACO|nr:hypothetical protein [Limosilactobacillus coleohominis]EEU30222.1 hypothetical protein HMPREF0501_01227 [Limosilactobacillus coleohominis 101-4-CHN]